MWEIGFPESSEHFGWNSIKNLKPENPLRQNLFESIKKIEFSRMFKTFSMKSHEEFEPRESLEQSG